MGEVGVRRVTAFCPRTYVAARNTAHRVRQIAGAAPTPFDVWPPAVRSANGEGFRDSDEGYRWLAEPTSILYVSAHSWVDDDGATFSWGPGPKRPDDEFVALGQIAAHGRIAATGCVILDCCFGTTGEAFTELAAATLHKVPVLGMTRPDNWTGDPFKAGQSNRDVSKKFMIPAIERLVQLDDLSPLSCEAVLREIAESAGQPHAHIPHVRWTMAA